MIPKSGYRFFGSDRAPIRYSMRSLLFVPGDSPRKLAKGLESGADALILDLEDSVAGHCKAEARATSLAFLKDAGSADKRPRLLVRVNSLDTGLTDADLDAVVAGRPDAILLPKAEGGPSVIHLDAKLAAREALAGLPDGAIDRKSTRLNSSHGYTSYA